MIDDATPQLNRCHGVDPDAVYGQISVICCPTCKEKVTVMTAPFFREDDRQREHEAWRATSAWNSISAGRPIRDSSEFEPWAAAWRKSKA